MSLEIDIKKNLASFSLEIAMNAEAETVGLLGESGCGKSMTLRCIAGIETPDEGKIIVNGKTYFDSAAHINLTPQERKTALLFQNYMLFPHMTVEANVAAGVDKNLSPEKRDEIISGELARFNIENFRKRYPMQLSGGQQQRVALARMLAAQPGILMLDEPFSALDAHLKDVLKQNLTDLFSAYDGTILYVSHDIDEALWFCDKIAVVNAGHIMEIDDPDDLVNHPKSHAALKLSGCKNITEAEYLDDRTVHLPLWGVDLQVDKVVPTDVKYIGIRAFMLEAYWGDDIPDVPNLFKMRVESIADSRFNRMSILSFEDPAYEVKEAEDDSESATLQHRIIWRVNRMGTDLSNFPKQGEEVYISFPPENIRVITR